MNNIVIDENIAENFEYLTTEEVKQLQYTLGKLCGAFDQFLILDKIYCTVSRMMRDEGIDISSVFECFSKVFAEETEGRQKKCLGIVESVYVDLTGVRYVLGDLVRVVSDPYADNWLDTKVGKQYELDIHRVLKNRREMDVFTVAYKNDDEIINDTRSKSIYQAGERIQGCDFNTKSRDNIM